VTGPVSVPITVTTHVSDRTVSHTLELAQAAIVVSVDRDIGRAHRAELMAALINLAELLTHVWAEIPRHGDVIVMDLRREDG